MTAQVIYLNRWLNCGDERLRTNHAMQIKISEAKARFWYSLSIQGITGYQAELCYLRFIHSNRDRLKIVKIIEPEDENDE